MQEGVEQRSHICEADLTVDFAQFWHKNIYYLKEKTLSSILLHKPVFKKQCEPGKVLLLVLSAQHYLEGNVENMTDKHQVLINAEIIHFVPVLVEDVETGLKPLFLVLRPSLLLRGKRLDYRGNPHGNIALVE